jgi:hypothetical protein
MVVDEKADPDLYTAVQEKNLQRQYDLMLNCVEIALHQRRIGIDKYTLWAFNHAAVTNISQFGGRFRSEPIYVGSHRPPRSCPLPWCSSDMVVVLSGNAGR